MEYFAFFFWIGNITYLNLCEREYGTLWSTCQRCQNTMTMCESWRIYFFSRNFQDLKSNGSFHIENFNLNREPKYLHFQKDSHLRYLLALIAVKFKTGLNVRIMKFRFVFSQRFK